MFSQITIIGYCGQNPTMRFTPGGQAVTSFSVATSRSYTGSDGVKVDETTWHKVSVWGSQAESCNQYLKKGSPVLVVGRLTPDKDTGGPRIWTGKDGQPHADFEIRAENVRFLPSGGRQQDSGEPEYDDDEMPF